ncbi:hypothetical protein [Streptomyces sp. NPDC005096]|uniref:hypothetical protein n=1 Tax=Streptomyces sp. NPDC005096 TaxID=3154559 RepID=UPI0033B3B290
MVFIAVVNHSTRISDGDVELADRACATQVRHHVAPEGGVKPLSVVYMEKDAPVPPGAYVIGVFDDSDQAGALGWHAKDGDAVCDKVFASPVLDSGGTALEGELSVSAVLSHEVLEAYLDPRVQLWASDADGAMWANEVCDPVEDSAYEVKVGGRKVSVSNWVTQAWFDSKPSGEEYDYMGKLSGPFEIAQGGYAVKYADGQVQQVYGRTFAEWKRPGKDHELSRMALRTCWAVLG